MSNYWDVGCKTCSRPASRPDGYRSPDELCYAGAFHWNHGEESILLILEHVDSLGSLSREVFAQAEVTFFGAEWSDFHALLDFAKAHMGHELEPCSKYGYFMSEPAY